MENKKSVSISKVSIIFLTLITVLCLVLAISAIHLGIQFRRYAKSSDLYTEVSHSALKLQEASDYLTEQVRLFVLTTDYQNLENYFFEIKSNMRREEAINELNASSAEKKSIEYLKSALEQSKELQKQEWYAMKLVVSGKHFDTDPSKSIPEELTSINLKSEDSQLADEYKVAKAWLLLFSQEYLDKKHEISELKSKAISEIFKYSEKTQIKSLDDLKSIFYRMITSIIFIFCATLFLFLGLMLLVIKPLHSQIINIRSGIKLSSSHAKELNILSKTYNEMFDKNKAVGILLRHKAEHDGLTGLINRSAFEDITEALTGSDKNIAFLIIDIDFFKLINDNYGHSAGDMVLKKVSKILTQAFRTSDYVARIGGDEFAVIMTDLDDNLEQNIQLITSKLNFIRDSLKEQEKDIPSVTLSIGVDLSSSGFSELLYNHADASLYEVKRRGRDGYSFYHEHPDSIELKENLRGI